jgi:hypothetical protein
MRIVIGSAFALLASYAANGLAAGAADPAMSPQWEWARGESTEMVPAGGSSVGFAACPAGKYPVSGGFQQNNNPASWTVTASYASGSGWRVNIRNTSSSQIKLDLYVWVLCARGVPQAPTSSAVPSPPAGLSAE